MKVLIILKRIIKAHLVFLDSSTYYMRVLFYRLLRVLWNNGFTLMHMQEIRN